jgi:hypothetical protein
LAIFQAAHWSAICMWISKFCIFRTSSQNYAGSKQKSYKIIIIKIFVQQDKAKPNIGNIKGLKLAAVKSTNVQVTKLPL